MEYINRAEREREREDRTNGPRPEALAAKLAGETTEQPVNRQEMINLILSKIDTISNQTQHLTEAVNAISKSDWQHIDDNNVVDTVVNGLIQVVREREETNRASLRLLEKMNDSMMPRAGKQAVDLQQLGILGIDYNSLLEHMEPKEQIAFIRELASL